MVKEIHQNLRERHMRAIHGDRHTPKAGYVSSKGRSDSARGHAQNASQSGMSVVVQFALLWAIPAHAPFAVLPDLNVATKGMLHSTS